MTDGGLKNTTGEKYKENVLYVRRLKKFRLGGWCGRRDRNEKSTQVERDREQGKEEG